LTFTIYIIYIKLYLPIINKNYPVIAPTILLGLGFDII